MQGDTPIKELKKAVIVFREKGNEIIKRGNRPWEIKLPDTRLGEAVVKGAKNKVTIDLSKLKTFKAVACDEEGNEGTYLIFGVKIS